MQKLSAGMAVIMAILANGLAGCDSASTANKFLPAKQSQSAPATKAINSSAFTALEQSTHQLINKYRKSRNLGPLTLNPRISEQARLHSQVMASGRVPFSHQGFDQRIQAISRVISYRTASENVAYNKGYSAPDRQAVQGWLNSSGHLKNIQGNYNLTGIGIAKNAKGEYYFTQIFIRSR